MSDRLRQREPRERESPYMGFIAGLCCVGCLVETGRYNRQVQVAHLRIPDVERGFRAVGMAEKPDDRRTTPLCYLHHTSGTKAQEYKGEEKFWVELCVDPFDLCLALSDAYDRQFSGYAVIARFAGQARKARARIGAPA